MGKPKSFDVVINSAQTTPTNMPKKVVYVWEDSYHDIIMLLSLYAVREIEIAGIFPVWGIVLVLGFMAAVLVAVTSKADKPPVYHCVSVLSLSFSLSPSLPLSLSLSLSLSPI